MARVVHFEIHADDPERAVEFYTKAFGWTITKWDGPMPYWLIDAGASDARGINGGLLQRHGPGPAEGQPVNSFVCTVEIEALEAALDAIAAAGGKLVVPTMPIPGVGRLAYVKDTEGNILGVLEPAAKQ